MTEFKNFSDKEELNCIVGKNIRAERQKRNITMEHLSEILDISPAFMGLIERGRRGIGLRKLVNLSSAFSIKMDELVFKNDVVKTYSENKRVSYLNGINFFLTQFDESELEYLFKCLSYRYERK